jgi:hypothetical protein
MCHSLVVLGPCLYDQLSQSALLASGRGSGLCPSSCVLQRIGSLPGPLVCMVLTVHLMCCAAVAAAAAAAGSRKQAAVLWAPGARQPAVCAAAAGCPAVIAVAVRLFEYML